MSEGISHSVMMTQYFLVVFAGVRLYHFEKTSQHIRVHAIKAIVSVGLELLLRAVILCDWTKWIPKYIQSTVQTYLTLCHSYSVF